MDRERDDKDDIYQRSLLAEVHNIPQRIFGGDCRSPEDYRVKFSRPSHDEIPAGATLGTATEQSSAPVGRLFEAMGGVFEEQPEGIDGPPIYRGSKKPGMVVEPGNPRASPWVIAMTAGNPSTRPQAKP